jgi:hypothetical protein
MPPFHKITFGVLLLKRTILIFLGGCLVVSLVQIKTTANESIQFENASGLLPDIEKPGDYGSFWLDIDKDGHTDLIFMGHGEGPLVLRQAPENIFTDVTRQTGIKLSGWSYPEQNDRHGGACADFDNDGIVDIAVVHGARRGETLGIKYDELLKGGSDLEFSDITHAAGVENPNGRARTPTWVDFDSDGWLDLYVTNYQSRNVLYRSLGNGKFEDVSDSSGLDLEQSRAAWSDFDQDGDQDVLLAWPLALFENRGNGSFKEVPHSIFKAGGKFAYAIAWSDIDGDLDVDIVASRLTGGNMIIINQNGEFLPAKGGEWTEKTENFGTGFSPSDFDNDGDIDIVQSRSDGIALFENAGDFGFNKRMVFDRGQSDPGLRHGDIAVADFDKNGTLDFAVDHINGYMLFRNTTASYGNWVELVFDGSASNRMGFGSKIWISIDGTRKIYREYTGADSSLRSKGCGPLHIGVGNHTVVDIEVEWPSGKLTEIARASTNRSFTIREPR